MPKRKELIPENWDEVEQRYLVQGIVIAVKDRRAHYVITHVLDGCEEILDDDFYPEPRSASTQSPWYSDVPNSYRALWYELEDTDPPNPLRIADKVDLAEGQIIVPGDTIHVHQTNFWKITGPSSKTGYPRYDVCKMPIANLGLEVMLASVLQQRRQKVEAALQRMQQNEQQEMLASRRLLPNQSERPFVDPGKHDPNENYYQTVTSRFVYGEGPVTDHFVDISARTAYEGDVAYGGVLRYGTDGSVYLITALLPFGAGSADDPLYELKITIHSQTIINPAVGELRPQVVIDGVTFAAQLDVEESSSRFKYPGHHVVFSGFRQDDAEWNMAPLTPEQSNAIFTRSKRERSRNLRILHEGLLRGEDMKEILDLLDDSAQQEALRAAKDHAHEQALIDSIKSNPSTYTISSGAPILVPRSMLDAVEIRFNSLED